MLEFIESDHIYLKNGILVKSVTQILQLIFPDKYKNIDKRILNKKARFGTHGHSIIEHLNLDDAEDVDKTILGIDNKDLEICIREYIRLVKTFKITPLEQEIRVSYKYLYAGTLDMTAKFTAELDKEYLSWQLGMYALAKGVKFDKYYCIWLKKGCLGKLVEITPKNKNEIINMLKELGIYER